MPIYQVSPDIRDSAHTLYKRRRRRRQHTTPRCINGRWQPRPNIKKILSANHKTPTQQEEGVSWGTKHAADRTRKADLSVRLPLFYPVGPSSLCGAQGVLPLCPRTVFML